MYATKRVFFKGRVQGVGFRYAVCRIAADYSVTGWVKNLPDGRVEMVSQGSAMETAEFVDAICERFGTNIHDCEVVSTEIDKQYPQFSIVH